LPRLTTPGLTLRRLWPALRIVLALAIFGVVLWRVDPGAAAEQVREAPAWVFAVPAAMLLGNSVLHALRLRLLAPVPAPPVRELLRIALVGNFFGLLLPSGGGEAVKMALLAGRVGGFERAVAILGVARLFELVPWALFLVWAAVAVLPGRLPAMVPLALLAAAAQLGVVVVGGLAMRFGEAFAMRLPHVIGTRVRRVTDLRASPGQLVACGLLAFPFALVNVLVVAAILRGYGARVPLGDVAGVVPTLDVVIALPVTVAGLGVREGMFVHAFSAWQVAEPVALAAAFTRWIAELGRGGLGGLWFALSRRRPEDVTSSSKSGR
jgi:uncharacterized membrane protein YbhN (UPF0104 family)